MSKAVRLRNREKVKSQSTIKKKLIPTLHNILENWESFEKSAN